YYNLEKLEYGHTLHVNNLKAKLFFYASKCIAFLEAISIFQEANQNDAVSGLVATPKVEEIKSNSCYLFFFFR
ncbi:hypothetical protein ACJX0J_009644, partial [Zea mays]